MFKLQAMTDKAAISLSILCTLHCLALPVFLVALPSLAALPLNNEAFHLWMIFAVVPISIIALSLGCKKHKQYRLFTLGCAGLAFLIAALTISETLAMMELFGLSSEELFEKTLTVIGALVISYAHFQNHRQCRRHESCACHNPDNKRQI